MTTLNGVLDAAARNAGIFRLTLQPDEMAAQTLGGVKALVVGGDTDAFGDAQGAVQGR